MTFGNLSRTAVVNDGGRGRRGKMRFETSYGSAGPGTKTKCISLAHFGYASSKSAKAEKLARQEVVYQLYVRTSGNLGTRTLILLQAFAVRHVDWLAAEVPAKNAKGWWLPIIVTFIRLQNFTEVE